MRKTALLVAALAASLTAALPSTAAAKKLPRCAEKKSITLDATRNARIYSRPSGNLVFACLYKKNRRVKLGSATSCDDQQQAVDYKLAGRYVGWVRAECGLASGFSDIVLTDLSTGRIVRSARGATPMDPNRSSAEYGVSEFVVNARGSMAWIGSYPVTGPAPEPDDRRQVRKLEAESASPDGTLVDSGPDIVVDSLALTRDGSGFYYRKGAEPLFGTLR